MKEFDNLRTQPVDFIEGEKSKLGVAADWLFKADRLCLRDRPGGTEAELDELGADCETIVRE